MTSLTIAFDDPTEVYVPGSKVTGTLQIVLTKRLKLNSVTLQVHGEARTRFKRMEPRLVPVIRSSPGDEGPQSVTTTATTVNTVHYDGHISYLEENILLWTPSKGATFLSPGVHNFPFGFLLPPNCASSFEGPNGCVRYYCTGKMDMRWWFNKRVEAPFTVLRESDLALNPTASCLAQTESSRQIRPLFCCCCCKRGRIHAKISLPKAGYAPGESLEVTAAITNGTSKPMKRIALKLQQVATYKGYKKSGNVESQLDEERIACALDEKIKVGARKTDTICKKLVIPPVPPTSDDCHIIKVKYALLVEISAKHSKSHKLEAQLPVIIGTAPVRSISAPTTLLRSNSAKVRAVQDSRPTSLKNLIFNGHVTTYEECILGKATFGRVTSEEFVPLYPVYSSLRIKS